MNEQPLMRLTCGCEVTTSRDFLGRVVGTIRERSTRCNREDHLPGKVVLMPGRDNAGSPSDFGTRSS
jgi:hypothetical protein